MSGGRAEHLRGLARRLDARAGDVTAVATALVAVVRCTPWEGRHAEDLRADVALLHRNLLLQAARLRSAAGRLRCAAERQEDGAAAVLGGLGESLRHLAGGAAP